jgi:cytochrome c556
MSRIIVSIILFSVFLSNTVIAGSDPIKARQHLMEETRDAAKVIGGMVKEERTFDAVAAMNALQIWHETATKAGDLFPEGSETGNDTEAKSTIWSDRAGFDAKMENFKTQVDAAIRSEPESLDELKVVAGPVFKACKACHDGYRVEKED